MKNPNEKKIYVTWSGGIDSTALIGQLLMKGWQVFPVTLTFGPLGYKEREAVARAYLQEFFQAEWGDLFVTPTLADGRWLENFANADGHIPRRNKHILDFMMDNFVIPNDGYYVGMGEYIGADTWVVKDHVGMHDADSRYLAAYLLHEYGLDYRFMALNDFGESRYKSDRVRLLHDAVGNMAMLTSNCMYDNPTLHCGNCYKCIERHVAFMDIMGGDATNYQVRPELWPNYDLYVRQMRGELVDLSWEQADER